MATGALGFGFGATLMALNTYSEYFFPTNADRAVLVLNAPPRNGNSAGTLVRRRIDWTWSLVGIADRVACVLALIWACVLREPLGDQFIF